MLDTHESIAVSFAVHEQLGEFISTYHSRWIGENNNAFTNSRDMILRHLLGENVIDITFIHRKLATDAIEFLKGLSFKMLTDRGLSSWEKEVLSIVTRDQIHCSSLSLIASLPKVYHRKIEQETWQAREAVLAASSEFVSTVGERQEFTVNIENIKSTDNFTLFCGSDKEGNIIKWFSDNMSLVEIGKKVDIMATIKTHNVSDYHNGKETMLNRVRLLGVKEEV